MLAKRRFYYCRSISYGWAVYDRWSQCPAWAACGILLPPVREDESGRVTVDPCCENEYQAITLCRKLNRLWDKDRDRCIAELQNDRAE